MKRSSLYCTLGLLTLLVAGIYSCKKVTGINNNNVVETPWSLYFSDTSGTLFVTTDGITRSPVVFPPDGKPCRALITSGNNILWAKNNLHYSTNNGQNFNQSYDSLNTCSHYNYAPVASPPLNSHAVNGINIDFNQSMLINLPTWNNRIYTVSWAPKNASGNIDFLGVVFSDNGGQLGSWTFEETYVKDTAPFPLGYVGHLPVSMTSLTQLANGYLCGLAYEPAGTVLATSTVRYVRNFFKPNLAGQWGELTANPDGIISITLSNPAGRPLPPTLASPDTSFFTLGHYNNRLIAIDNKGEYGAWYSDDFGANWAPFTGLPANIPLLCISSPFEEVCLIGTDSAGLYIYNSNIGSWQQNNNGVSKNLIVRNIAFKETVYKNGTVKKYIFLATNMGIFQSTDGGLNWILTIPGNYVAAY